MLLTIPPRSRRPQKEVRHGPVPSVDAEEVVTPPSHRRPRRAEETAFEAVHGFAEAA